MTYGLEALKGASPLDAETCVPLFFRLHKPGDQHALDALIAATPAIEIHDEILGQLMELVKSQKPEVQFSTGQLRSAALEHLGNTPADQYGVWVFYPWSRRLVHLLDATEFALVRTDRNRNKITREEQERLSRLKVGVIGLSVGRSVVMTMALERGFGEIRLADHDVLELSNLNRIQCGTHQLGINKTISLAREIAELDPFLKVTCFTGGITRENIDSFFTNGGRLDILVEECDGVDIKILARQKAKELRVPVVMDTNDRGMVDVERFDLEPDRKILHGLIDHLDPEDAARARTNEEKLPFLAPMAGLDNLSPRMKASMIEIGQSITTWPQLATGTALGGALAADACRRIALDQFRSSGRWYVDIDKLVGGPAEPRDEPAADLAPSAGSPSDLRLEEMISDAARLQMTGTGALDGEQARALAQAGALAPSADNMQPWQFLFCDGRLLLFHDRARSASELDPSGMIAHIALGMCIENILLRASQLKIPIDHVITPVDGDQHLIAAFALGKGETTDPPAASVDLAEQITLRHTNRRKGLGTPIEEDVLSRSVEAAESVPGARIHLIRDSSAIDALAAICGAADRIRIMNEHGHREFFQHQLRWTSEEAERTGDGLDIATLELTGPEHIGLRMASSPRAIHALAAMGGGRALEKISSQTVRTSAAVALVTMPGTETRQRIDGGRAMQRLWLRATQLGLAVHPISAPIFLAHPVRHGNGAAFQPAERTEILSLFNALGAIFKLEQQEPLMMVRLSHAGAATARSLRRPMSDLFHVAHLEHA